MSRVRLRTLSVSCAVLKRYRTKTVRNHTSFTVSTEIVPQSISIILSTDLVVVQVNMLSFRTFLQMSEIAHQSSQTKMAGREINNHVPINRDPTIPLTKGEHYSH